MKKFTRIEPTIVKTVGNRFKRDTIVKTFRTDDGKLHEFTTWNAEGRHSGGAIVVTKDKQVVTLYQFRGGPERWMYELPGGGLLLGEDVEAGVQREVLEETGYVPSHMEFLGTHSRDAYTNGTWHYYLATDCILTEGGRRPDAEEEDQGSEVRLISIAEFIENAKHDRMTDPVAVLMAYDKLMKLQEG